MLPNASAGRRALFSRFLANTSLSLVSIAFALGAVEGLLRMLPPSREYFAVAPGTDVTLTLAPDLFPGVEGVSHVRVNRFGVRGRPFGDDHAEYRMLAVGGSTTECVVLDDAEAWTHLLETGLARTSDGREVWVGNVGRSGATTRDNILHIKYLLRQYPRIDDVVALEGVNDVLSALQQGWQYRLPAPVTDPAAESAQMPRAFARVAGRLQDQSVGARPVPWYKETALWQLGRRAKQALQVGRVVNLREKGLRLRRLRRHTAPESIDSLPPLELPLLEYRRNLNTMADLAMAAGARLTLVTQPSAWQDGMSEAAERLLFLGSLGEHPMSARAFFTARALGRGMARYNETLLDVCRERRLDCVDAASLLPRDTTAMYDDIHFNENGSRLLARVLVQHFRGRPPFRF